MCILPLNENTRSRSDKDAESELQRLRYQYPASDQSVIRLSQHDTTTGGDRFQLKQQQPSLRSRACQWMPMLETLGTESHLMHSAHIGMPSALTVSLSASLCLPHSLVTHNSSTWELIRAVQEHDHLIII
jgi:hypothetical protein